MFNIENTRNLLHAFDFKSLFIEELGWNNPTNRKPVTFATKSGEFSRKPLAELSAAVVFEITTSDGSIPDSNSRAIISNTIEKIHFEHILIFVDRARNECIWRWIKKQDKKSIGREHYFSKGQTGDLFISKLAGLFVDISEIENDIKITDVANKIKSALDIEKVVKKFYGEYQTIHFEFLELIQGINNESDRRWYASVILDRLMFIYFLQKKMFLDGGDDKYLSNKLSQSRRTLGKNRFYSDFLHKLFFEGFAKNETQRTPITNKLIGKIKYLNGGLFLEHKIEIKYKGKIKIPDIAFDNLFALFDRYSWTLNDTPGGKDNEMNPDVLGYIFEKYINQKAFGAYYTRTEITEYLCEQTIYKLILEEVNGEKLPENIPDKLKEKLSTKQYSSIAELLLNLDTPICKKLVVGENALLPNLSLLDPACGSGAFLVAAMKTLINVYSAILGKIDFLGDKKLSDWKNEIIRNHPSINYYIKKQIITNNLYGVDLMEEATEIAKLRLFLALVASAETVDQLEPLPNIDFNIMNGNSLVGLMRVDEGEYNKHQSEDLFKKSYRELVNNRETALRAFKSFENSDENIQIKKEAIDHMEQEAYSTLDLMLGQEFNNLEIKYEQITWDNNQNKQGKSIKRRININDIRTLEPFHWGYKFSEIFRKKNGFDAIITNPPWETVKPIAKEFFTEYSDLVSRRKMTIKDFEKEQEILLKDKEIRTAWLEYLSKYPHMSSYFRSALQYKNQISIVNGRKAGSDINLYKLFTEQCYNLLRTGGYCGIVIPAAIYSDLGTKQLRNLLFNSTKITGLFCFENKKEIFENVHRSFKFVVLSFEKGGSTKSFPAAFMRTSVDELIGFPTNGASEISIDFIKKQSPESYSIMEIKNDFDFRISNKMMKFPLISSTLNDGYDFSLTREFDMTNDSHIFQTKSGKNSLQLYEGKMINQFDAYFAEPKYWINEKKGRSAKLGKIKDNGQLLSYQKYRFGIRSITGNTNWRTLIVGPLPKNVFCGNSLLVSADRILENGDKAKSLNTSNILYYQGILNSFTVDFYIRPMVSININMFYVNQLPIPRLESTNKWFHEIVERTAKLICITPDFIELWEDVIKSKWSLKLVATKEEERNKLRAELDAIIAHIYGLDEEELIYILTTFPSTKALQKDNILQYFNDIANQFSNEIKSNNNLSELIDKGENPTLEFKSTLRVDIKTGKPEKFIEHSIIKTLAAFLNSAGGTLLIGVEDNRNVFGLDLDFKSFSKEDKLDEFQKHFDNLISNSLGNRFQRNFKIEFHEIEQKMVCLITIKEKSSEPVYVSNLSGQETFYIRRQASTIDLKPSEIVKYIKDHWY